MKKWIAFYEPHFPTAAAAAEFVARCESTPGPHPAKIIMHQTQRLLTLAEEMAELRPRRDGLQLLFLMICAENVSKLHDDFHEDGHSRKYAIRFFETFLSEAEKQCLESNFSSRDDAHMSTKEIADAFYKVRCAVVHEGSYWSFSLSDDGVPTTSIGSPFFATMSIATLRELVARGSIRAAEARLSP